MKNSNIEWTDHSWNPWYGCHKVSQGCAHCYMFREQQRFGRDPGIVQRSRTTFRAPLSWARAARRRQARQCVFTCSWSDFFIEDADAWRAEAWEIIRQTPELIYLILTKRPERIAGCLPEDWGLGWEHVWLGVSVEDQAAADRRVPLLLEIQSQGRFVSAERLLGKIDLLRCVEPDEYDWDQVNLIDDETEPEELIEECEAECDWINYGNDLVVNPEYREWINWRNHRAHLFALHSQIDWVIAGGESGPQARPCDPAWVRALRDQCGAADVPFFFKQWGEYLPLEAPGVEVDYLGVGRKQAGRTLDGREWQERPQF